MLKLLGFFSTADIIELDSFRRVKAQVLLYYLVKAHGKE